MNRYRNPWANDTLVRRPAFYENNARAVYAANGWTVYKTHERGYDYVFADCAITQRAGASDPAGTIARILSGEEFVHDEVGAHLRAHGLTCKTYADASLTA